MAETPVTRDDSSSNSLRTTTENPHHALVIQPLGPSFSTHQPSCDTTPNYHARQIQALRTMLDGQRRVHTVVPTQTEVVVHVFTTPSMQNNR